MSSALKPPFVMTVTEFLAWDAAGNWPPEPLVIEAGNLRLESVDFSVPLVEVYRTTRLAQGT